MKQTTTHKQQFSIDFAASHKRRTVTPHTFFAFVKKQLPRLSRKGVKTAAQDIDKIVYGVK